MSDDEVIIIPIEPEFVPDGRTRAAAWRHVVTFVPEERIRTVVTDHPVFVDCGGNWEGVRCPACSSTLDDEWWRAQVDRASTTDFVDLRVVTPCCRYTTSLNDLDYVWQVGFARFQLVVENPTARVPVDVVQHVAKLIGAPVRVVHRHN